jgi:hypothetical protein
LLFSPVAPVLFACSAAAPRLRLPHVIPAYGCGRAHGMLAFSISRRLHIDDRSDRKLFDFDALRMASVSADTVFGRKNAEILLFC